MAKLIFTLVLFCMAGLRPAVAGPVWSEGGDAVRPLFKEAFLGRGASRAAWLDTLFEQLAQAREPGEARRLEDIIYNIWNDSGSTSVDLLMQRGERALSEGKTARALRYFSWVTTLAPGFVEGWNKKAAAHFLMKRYELSLKSVEKTLELEPRHFGALGKMAAILRAYDRNTAALATYRRLIALHPNFEGAVKAVRELTEKVEGKGI